MTSQRQFCRIGIHSCIPAVTLTFANGSRRLHWCAQHQADAEPYRSTSDQPAAQAPALGACLHAGCHPGRCVYGPDHGLPDPNITGPCQVQSSPFCEPSAGRQRMDPMDMAEAETSFRAYVMCCQFCYDHQADEYIRVTHGGM